jgi:energy-coupling factor transporter ATP-binding protein EcfA2
LVDESDLLNTGIEIVAKPPGKKLQTLSLLSGGERALTAIALLFAILKTRPVPFCVLDEVEAALDEANVHRFGEYIRTLSIDTQFVIIGLTHGLVRLSAAQATSISYGQVGFAALWGWLLFGERLDPWTLAGGGLILSSILLSQGRPPRGAWKLGRLKPAGQKAQEQPP